MRVMNDGSHTRDNTRSVPSSDPHSSQPPSGGKSAPDVSLCGPSWSSRSSWRTTDAIGSSDHLPILITLNHKVKLQSILKGQDRWCLARANWDAFTAEVEDSIDSAMPDDSSIDVLAEGFRSTLINAATSHVGTSRPGKGRKSWETPKVRDAIRKRNRLRQFVGTRRAEWLAACKTARQTIDEAKTDAWRNVLEDASNSQDDAKMWRTIRSLNGSPDSNSPNEAMVHGDRLITSNKRKADIFVGHYSSVGKIPMTKKDRTENRALKERIRDLRSRESTTPDIRMHELKRAIAAMKPRGAPGPDRISPSFLKHLGPKALNQLLRLQNLCLRKGYTPQAWRNATILPLLKANKPPSELGSFRPISLTSCVAKVMERIISDRLYDLAESSGWFSSFQAGFRKGRGVEDQVLRVVQKISDGFQRKEKSLLVLLDFSKAYDTIWRQRLLHTLLNIGVPGGYVVWLSSFLQNRQARVRFNGELSKSRGMNQGLPQGSVLAPILFLFYINELAKLLPTDLVTAMYADDVSFLASSVSTQHAEASAQAAVNIVVNWSREWKLVLNGSKSETSCFSLGGVWCPNIRINNRVVRYEPNPKLLGVTLDRTLTFGKHVERITARASQKQHILRAVSHSSWGWRKPDLRKIYLSLVGSILNYAGAAWQPWLSQTHINSLERAQNRCLRLITTQALCAPTEALRAESEIGSLQATISANILRSREKGLRLPSDHPRSIAFCESAPDRLKSKPGARLKAELLSRSLPSLSPLSSLPGSPSISSPCARGTEA